MRKCTLDRKIHSHLVLSQGDYKIPNIHGELDVVQGAGGFQR